MEWSEQQRDELLQTLAALVAALNAHQAAIDVALACIEQLDARTMVMQSAYHGLVARLEKIENCTYGDGK